MGRDKPLVGTLDPHANLSPAMVAACDALVAYRTNPHLDQKERGVEAAALMVRTLRGEIRPAQRAAFPPLAINIERQSTDEEPCRGLLQLAAEMRERRGVLSTSLQLGFPYADVVEMGSSVLAVTDDDPQLAQRCADELAAAMWSRRHELVGKLVDAEAALDQAEPLTGPICLLDMGDNVGGGSPADGTILVHALRRRRLGPSLACLYDPAAVQRATAAGVGQRVELTVGGKTDARHGPPISGSFTVVRLAEGTWEEPQPRHGGFAKFDQGPTAVVTDDDGLTLMLTSRRMAPFSLRQLTSCGVDPAQFRFLVAKGVHAPVAAYAPVCRHLIRVDTPGVTQADHRRPRPAQLRERAQPRLSGGVRHALHLRAGRAGGEPDLRPHLHLDRSAHRFRDAGGLRWTRAPASVARDHRGPMGLEVPPYGAVALSPLNQRRWQNFKANRRGYWSLWLFLVLFVISLFAEFIANDKPF